MSQRIRERLEDCPVIAAVRDEEGLRECLKFLAQGSRLLVLPKPALHSDLCLRAACRKLEGNLEVKAGFRHRRRLTKGDQYGLFLLLDLVCNCFFAAYPV